MENRFFLMNGHFHIIPHPHFSSYKRFPVHPSIEEALSLLPFPATAPIETAIQSRLRRTDKSMSLNAHHFYCLLPRSWSKIVSIPLLMTHFSHLFIDSTPVEKDQTETALRSIPSQEDLTVFDVVLSKLLFLQLISCLSKESKIAGREEFLAAAPEER